MEIKFRAWDKKGTFVNNKIDKAEPHMLDSVGISIAPDNLRGKKAVWFNNYGQTHIPTNDSNFILMQFTGMADLKGKEIYEGDIVQDEDGYIGVVKWDGDGYRWFVDDNCNLFGLDEYEMFGLEVIGNVHENPEMWDKAPREQM
jgi:uncharacterized phage protein (TIGR01671 family)